MKNEEIRINILRVLYSFYKEKPLNFLKTELLLNEIGTEEKELLWHLNYLLDAGYIEGKRFKTFESLGYLEKIKITSKGINVLQPASEFDRLPRDVQINKVIEDFVLNVKEEIERGEISQEEKSGLLEEVDRFLTDPRIVPFVGATLLRLRGTS